MSQVELAGVNSTTGSNPPGDTMEIAEDDLQEPPVDVGEETIPDWMVEEAGEGYDALLNREAGDPHLPSEEERGAPPCADYLWPSPTRRWRTVTVIEHQIDGSWDVDDVICDCGRQKGTGRHCAHAFRVIIDALQLTTYKLEWLHPHFRSGGPPGSGVFASGAALVPSVVASASTSEEGNSSILPAGTTSSTFRGALLTNSQRTDGNGSTTTGTSGEEEVCDSSDLSMVRDLHLSVAKAYGNGLVDCLYYDTDGPGDAVAMGRFEALRQLWEWIHASNGDILCDIVKMVNSKKAAEANAASAAATALGATQHANSSVERVENARSGVLRGGGRVGSALWCFEGGVVGSLRA